MKLKLIFLVAMLILVAPPAYSAVVFGAGAGVDIHTKDPGGAFFVALQQSVGNNEILRLSYNKLNFYYGDSLAVNNIGLGAVFYYPLSSQVSIGLRPGGDYQTDDGDFNFSVGMELLVKNFLGKICHMFKWNLPIENDVDLFIAGDAVARKDIENKYLQFSIGIIR